LPPQGPVSDNLKRRLVEWLTSYLTTTYDLGAVPPEVDQNPDARAAEVPLAAVNAIDPIVQVPPQAVEQPFYLFI
jgi:hypothetical protein